MASRYGIENLTQAVQVAKENGELGELLCRRNLDTTFVWDIVSSYAYEFTDRRSFAGESSKGRRVSHEEGHGQSCTERICSSSAAEGYRQSFWHNRFRA